MASYQSGYKLTDTLLTADFLAKLSDFGISKAMEMDQSLGRADERETCDYVHPNYQRNRCVNAKGDVYSFGIVLLQQLSGQKVKNLNPKGPMQLHKLVRSKTMSADFLYPATKLTSLMHLFTSLAKFLAIDDNTTEFADPKLNGLNGEYSVEAVDLVLELALSWTGMKPAKPSMEQVVFTLKEALDISTRKKKYWKIAHCTLAYMATSLELLYREMVLFLNLLHIMKFLYTDLIKKKRSSRITNTSSSKS